MSARWPVSALVVLAAMAPFNVKLWSSPWTDLELRALVVGALAIALVVAVREVVVGPRRLPDRIEWLALAWLLGVWLAAFTSDDLLLGAGGAAQLSVAIVLIPAVRSAVRNRDDAMRILRALAAGTVLAALFALGVWVLGDRVDGTRFFAGMVTRLGAHHRLTRPWAHANVAAMALGMTMASVSTLGRRAVVAPALVVVSVAMVLTISRGGLLAAVCGALTWIVLRRRPREIALVCALGALGAVVFAASPAWEARVDQLGDAAFYAASITPPDDITLGIAGDEVDVTITNRSTTVWRREGDQRVLISARWLGPDDRIWVEDWWQLPEDLMPGQSLTAPLGISIRVPTGDYRLRWDLVIPETAYFGQFLGDAPVMSAAVVTESAVTVADIDSYDVVPHQIELSRRQIWRLAWTEFTDSPLVGIGPNQFAQSSVDALEGKNLVAGAHAHNIVLEPLTAWGLIGAVPFLVLLVDAIGIGLHRAWRSRELTASIVAASLVAIGVHGLVDWPLVTVTTGIPFGIIVGLALCDQAYT